MHTITHNLGNLKLKINLNFANNLLFFSLLLSSDSCHKKMLLESQNIPLKGHWTTSASSPIFFSKKLRFLYH